MRPLYETADHLSRETEFAQKIQERFNCELKKLPISHKIDFAAVREDQVVAWLEIKIRNCCVLQYNTYMISYSKYQELKLKAFTSGNAAIIAVRWNNEDRFYRVNESNVISLRWGGRTVQRRDFEDVEPMVHIPVAEMISF